MMRIVLKTERRMIPGAPVITDYEIFEIEAPEVEERIRSGGYSEDGTFSVTQAVGFEVPRNAM